MRRAYAPSPVLLVGLVAAVVLAGAWAAAVLGAARATARGVEPFAEGEGMAKTVATVQAPSYTIKVVDTNDARLGRCVMLDGRAVSCQNDEHRRHETLVHLACQYLLEQAPRRVLIVGGADCMALREVLKYPASVMERVVVVDDQPHLRSVFETHMGQRSHRGDPRVTWLDTPPLEGVQRQDAAQFDLVLVDLKGRPGSGPDEADPELYREARARMTHQGVLVKAGAAQEVALRGLFQSTLVVTFRQDATHTIEHAVLAADFDLAARTEALPPGEAGGGLDRHRVHTSYYKTVSHKSHLPWWSGGLMQGIKQGEGEEAPPPPAAAAEARPPPSTLSPPAPLP